MTPAPGDLPLTEADLARWVALGPAPGKRNRDYLAAQRDKFLEQKRAGGTCYADWHEAFFAWMRREVDGTLRDPAPRRPGAPPARNGAAPSPEDVAASHARLFGQH